jgi:hypothetical protein
MSVESWSQGQSNQRQRILIESAQANPAITPALFAEPKGRATSMIGGEPPDASNKQPDDAQPDKPGPTQPENPSEPKGEQK